MARSISAVRLDRGSFRCAFIVSTMLLSALMGGYSRLTDNPSLDARRSPAVSNSLCDSCSRGEFSYVRARLRLMLSEIPGAISLLPCNGVTSPAKVTRLGFPGFDIFIFYYFAHASNLRTFYNLYTLFLCIKFDLH